MEETKLHDAVRSGNESLIRSLIQQDKTLVNKKDAYGNTPLHTAIVNGKPRQ